jgi:hypothetical protein
LQREQRNRHLKQKRGGINNAKILL